MSIHLIGDFLFFWLHIIIGIFNPIIQSELMLFLDCLSLFTRLSMVWFSAGLGTFDLNLNPQNRFGLAVCQTLNQTPRFRFSRFSAGLDPELLGSSLPRPFLPPPTITVWVRELDLVNGRVSCLSTWSRSSTHRHHLHHSEAVEGGSRVAEVQFSLVLSHFCQTVN